MRKRRISSRSSRASRARCRQCKRRRMQEVRRSQRDDRSLTRCARFSTLRRGGGTMRRRRHEAGEGQAGCLVGLIFLLIAIFIAYKMVPVKVKAADLRQTVVDEAKSAGSHGDDQIRKQILLKAQDDHLPVA